MKQLIIQVGISCFLVTSLCAMEPVTNGIQVYIEKELSQDNFVVVVVTGPGNAREEIKLTQQQIDLSGFLQAMQSFAARQQGITAEHQTAFIQADKVNFINALRFLKKLPVDGNGIVDNQSIKEFLLTLGNPQAVMDFLEQLDFLLIEQRFMFINKCIAHLPVLFAQESNFSYLMSHQLRALPVHLQDALRNALTYDARTAALQVHFFVEKEGRHRPGSSAVAWSPDGQSLASGSSDNAVLIWRKNEQGEWISNELRRHTGEVTSVAWSPDGQSLASGSWDNAVRIWRKNGRGEWISNKLPRHTSQVNSVAWSPDGQSLASGLRNNRARIWRKNAQGKWISNELDQVDLVVWSPDGQSLASGSWNTTVRIWRKNEQGEWISNELCGHTREVDSVAWSPDGQSLASGSRDNTVRIWRKNGQGEWISNELPRHTSHINLVAWSPDGQSLALGSENGMVGIYTFANIQACNGYQLLFLLTLYQRYKDHIPSQLIVPSRDNENRSLVRKLAGWWTGRFSWLTQTYTSLPADCKKLADILMRPAPRA